MLRNYFKIAIRNINRNKAFAFINISGLTIGITACLLILFWVKDEVGFDKYNKNFDNIYRIINEQKFEDRVLLNSKTPVPLGPALTEDFPEIINYTRYGTFVGEVLIRNKENAFYELGGAYADASYFDIFTVDFLQGQKEDIFPDRLSTVITRSMAQKYFGNQDPVGQTLELENICDLKVTAVIEDIPENSHLQFDFAVPYNLYEAWGADFTNWSEHPDYTYLLLEENTNADVVNSKIEKYLQGVIKDNKDRIFLQPLGRIHLYSNFAYDYPAVLGDINTLYIFSLIGFLILIIACINFINLTTASSLKRAKEVGLRKVVGANRSSLIKQFLGETIILAGIAFCFVPVFIELVLPSFNNLIGKNLVADWSDVHIISGAFLIVLFAGFFSGLYPAFFLSSYKPVSVLKGAVKFGSKGSVFRKGLIVFQFFLSVSLIICTIVVYKQLDYIKQKKLGFNKDYVVSIQSRPGMYRDYSIFKAGLLTHPEIINVTATEENGFPVPIAENSLTWTGKDPTEKLNILYSKVDYDYFETFETEILQGRSFSKDFASDSSAVVLNESAVKVIGQEYPVGKQLQYYGKDFTIIGIVKDFHSNSLHSEIHPVVTFPNPPMPFSLYIKVSSANLQNTLKIIEEEWEKIVPDFPFDYSFLDEKIANLYEYEKKIGRIFSYFAIFAILISCMGLFGLATFIAESRTKEIGIRKVLGCSSGKIAVLLTKDFTKWVILGNIIAWPIAWFLMNKWLQNFAYQTKIDIWVFVLAGVIALLIALFTVSFQTIKAINSNPVEALKYE